MSADGQGTKWRRNIAENFNRLSRVHQRYRQTDDRQTDGPSMTYSEHELEFTFANKMGESEIRLRLCNRSLFIFFLGMWFCVDQNVAIVANLAANDK